MPRSRRYSKNLLMCPYGISVNEGPWANRIMLPRGWRPIWSASGLPSYTFPQYTFSAQVFAVMKHGMQRI